MLIPKGSKVPRAGTWVGPTLSGGNELNAMIGNSIIRAIFPVRGGYGLTRILDRSLTTAALRKDPKIITGFSDLTALHLAIAGKARLVTFHSPMPMRKLWQEDKPEFVYAARSFRARSVRRSGRR